MNQTAVVIYLSLVAALVFALATAGVVSVAAARPLRALCAGDSITSSSGYPEALAEATGWQVANGGIPGAMSAGVRRRLAVALARYQYDVIVLCAGINDRDPRDTARNLAAIVAEADRYGTRLIVLTYAGTGDHVDQLNATIRALPCPCIDFASVARSEYLQADGVHLRPVGAQALAELVAAAI